MQGGGTSRGAVLIWPAVIVSGLGIAAYSVWFALGASPGREWLTDEVLYNGPIIVAAIACLIRAATTRHQRAAWAAFGLGLAAWGVGDVYWTEVLAELKRIPYPSLADAGFLLAVPCMFVGIAVLARERLGRGSASVWFDGAITAVAAAAAAAAVLGPALVGLTKGDTATVLTNLAYPIGDVLLIAFIVALLVVGGFRDARSLLWIGAGLLAWTAADIAYLWTEATGTWTDGWLDLLWPLGALLIAISAALAPRAAIPRRRDYRPGLGVPLLSTGLAVLVLVWDHYDRSSEISIWLAAGTLLLVAVRLAISFRENARLVAALHDDAITDQLTGLGNRRALFNDLERLLAAPAELGHADLFALFDLDGFKAYNDSYGHPAGDALLARLGANLRAAAGREGRAYRLGGDEFCVLIEVGERKADSVVALLRTALGERGEGFLIGASCGTVFIPREAATPSEVLRIADKRLYAEKAERSTRTGELTRHLLMRIVREREPELGEHVESVAGLARDVGRRIGLEGEEVDVLIRAAELHDVGKIAIPEDILHKPGPLTDVERDLMRRHTLIGERILGVTPALAPVAKVVRSSHERWDGDGYPDGLAGEEIPLAARIIFVCDAFEAMTAGRPYKAAVSVEQALRELRRNAGGQFDPRVVAHFCEMVAAAPAAPGAASSLRSPA